MAIAASGSGHCMRSSHTVPRSASSVSPLPLVGEAAFVNQQAAIRVAAQHGVFDLIEAHHDGFESAQQP